MPFTLPQMTQQYDLGFPLGRQEHTALEQNGTFF